MIQKQNSDSSSWKPWPIEDGISNTLFTNCLSRKLLKLSDMLMLNRSFAVFPKEWLPQLTEYWIKDSVNSINMFNLETTTNSVGYY